MLNVEVEMFDSPTCKLFIGDICYALDGEIYDKVWGHELNYKDSVIKVDKDVAAVVAGTAYGDGEYTDTMGRRFPVDAGVIGVTNLKYGGSPESLRRCGTVVEVKSGKAIVEFDSADGYFIIKITDSETSEVLYDDTIDTRDDMEDDEC